MMGLMNAIYSAVTHLEQLLDRARAEFERDDLPSEWDDDLGQADLAAQDAYSQIGSASDFIDYLATIEAMLGRIAKLDGYAA